MVQNPALDLQLTWAGSWRTRGWSCWCAGTRRPPCSPSSATTRQSGPGAGSPGCLVVGSPSPPSERPSSRGQWVQSERPPRFRCLHLAESALEVQPVSHLCSGTVCCPTGTLCSTRPTPLDCRPSGWYCCPLLVIAQYCRLHLHTHILFVYMYVCIYLSIYVCV